MPYKHLDKKGIIRKKHCYKVTNWKEYNNALRQRGDITIWFTEEAIKNWRPARTGERGRSKEYSDHAIETALFLRQVFHKPLRQTEGMMRSIIQTMNIDISTPDLGFIA